MENFSKHIQAYKSALKQGDIQHAYKGIIEYISMFKIALQKENPEYNVPNKMYEGVMDTTYFAFSPEYLKQEKLKIALVFHHETFCFEVWLVGQNKKVQAKYWDIFKQSNWSTYPITGSPEHAIIRHKLIQDADFSNLNQLKTALNKGLVKFTGSIIDVFKLEQGTHSF